VHTSARKFINLEWMTSAAKTNRIWLVLILGVGVWLSCPPARADVRAPTTPAGLKEMSLEELSQIDITSVSREPRPAFGTPAAVYVITSDDIRRSGANSIPEILRLAPGVEVARIDSNKWSIGIRGFGSRLSRSVLVLIDGRTVYTTLLAGTYWEVQDTTLEDIDRIEVIRGPGGTIWGPNAVDGVINIITKPPSETRGTLVSAGGGNVEQGFVNLRHGGGDGKNLNYRVYAKAYTRGPEVHPDHGNFDDWRGTQGGFRMDWKRDEHNSLDVQGDLYTIEAGERVEGFRYEALPFDRILEGNEALSGGNIMAKWTHQLSENNDLLFQLYYDRANRRELNFGDLRDTFDFDFVQHVGFGARQRITWGAGARASHGHDLQAVSGLTFRPSERTDQLYSAYFQDQIDVVPNKLVFTAGTKMLRTNFSALDFEPSGRVMWTPGKNEAVWASYTHALRTPSDAEEEFFLSGPTGQTLDGLPEFARFNGNRGFAPEQMNGLEAGFRQLLGKNMFVDVATFYNHYHDLFDEEITGPPFLETNPAPPHYLLPAKFGNGLLGTTKGFEISPEFRPTESWRLRGSYSYLMMQIGPAPGSLDIGSWPAINGSSPRHQVFVQSSFDIGKPFSLDLTYRYVSALVATNQNVPAYSTGDVRFGWHLKPSMDLSLVGHNLFQPSHGEFNNESGGLIGIDRSFFAKLTWGQ